MPLKKGKTDEILNKNIEELIGKYKKTGKIGTSTPPSIEAAAKQAAAIAYNKAENEEKPKYYHKEGEPGSGLHWMQTVTPKNKLDKVAGKYISIKLLKPKENK